MDGSHDIQHTSGLVAGPKPVASASGGKLGVLERLGTPLWIAVGIATIALAFLAAFS